MTACDWLRKSRYAPAGPPERRVIDVLEQRLALVVLDLVL